MVAFELKIDKFRPEFISKMDFYLEALDRQKRKYNENPSVGVILCASKDEQVVEYAMSRTMSPTMVSQYTLKLIDKKLLEEKLKEINDIVEENNKKNLGDIAMDEHRLKHALSVARKMVEIADKINLNENEKEICFLIGYNHDIGYEFTDEEINHNKVGGEILKKTGFKYWREIYYHGESDTEFTSTYLNILNQADMQIDRYGNDVGYDKRLEDIRNRYGKNSIIYKKCCKLVEKLKVI